MEIFSLLLDIPAPHLPTPLLPGVRPAGSDPDERCERDRAVGRGHGGAKVPLAFARGRGKGRGPAGERNSHPSSRP